MKVSRPIIICLLLTLGALALLGAGCTPQQTTSQSEPIASNSEQQPPLPAWAPENPSPEFLRAAAVLKPLPREWMESHPDAEGFSEAILKRYSLWWLAAYEFFGTLSDEQISDFQSSGKIRIPVGSLTDRQRRGFEGFMNAWNEAFRGTAIGDMRNNDVRVSYYKLGARKDLSNVEVGFDIEGQVVALRVWVLANGKTVSTGSPFATL